MADTSFVTTAITIYLHPQDARKKLASYGCSWSDSLITELSSLRDAPSVLYVELEFGVKPACIFFQ